MAPISISRIKERNESGYCLVRLSKRKRQDLDSKLETHKYQHWGGIILVSLVGF